ncbi:PREDICTED: collagen triple helix repeat-containing protein 1-like [Priapulus caudatus]|uniref:Collagen triple helix repeat-containing protein 1-like n=1 Tax=Priapulus caudatus TaxID=37621 RepID=A0ABM1ENS0_PRICU|nr:PREDICTED: collagen triple helix repeat-containing protein 1-like [Priapulus caudatus]
MMARAIYIFLIFCVPTYLMANEEIPTEPNCEACRTACRDGRDGRDGIAGRDGRDGVPGACLGENGEKGYDGPPGSCVERKVYQCTWDSSNDDTDMGIIHQCNATKLSNTTGLLVRWSGSLRNRGDQVCNRWFVTFNGTECLIPALIDAQLYSGGDGNSFGPATIEGICYALPRGEVQIELRVGSCLYYSLGDSLTGWDSVSRMIIEEETEEPGVVSSPILSSMLE